jgi:hypothetical protein
MACCIVSKESHLGFPWNLAFWNLGLKSHTFDSSSVVLDITVRSNIAVRLGCLKLRSPSRL